jgi:THO complex subunit 2
LAEIRDALGLVFESGCLAEAPKLYIQLCRFVTGRLDLALLQHQNDPEIETILDIVGYLLPSSSLFEHNPTLSHTAWSMIASLPYSTRYGLYREWRGEGSGPYSTRSSRRPLWLADGEAKALKSARYVLKRLSHDTIRDQCRALAKICHSHPLVVFTTILGQIESYDNLVAVMVDALRFVTPLSLDVLSWCILSRLGDDQQQQQGGIVNRSRLKEDGVNLSQWLQSLEAFVGSFYKRYPHVDCTGLLSYLQHRLKDGHVMEIGLLRTLLKTSAGWAFCDYSPAASLSASQLEGLSGSALLRRETMSFGVVEAVNPRASEKLRQILQNRSVGVVLLILLAQVRQHIIFGGSNHDGGSNAKPVIKLVAHLVDNCQVLICILLDFLTDPAETRSNKGLESDVEGMRYGLSPRMQALKVYASSLPSLRKLSEAYKVDYASSWMMCRPLIRAAMWKQLEADAATENGRDTDGDQPMEEATSASFLSVDWMDAFKSTKQSHELYKQMLPDSTWSHFTTDLFETFFTYALFDVVCPEDTYATEIARLEKQAERLSQQRPASSAPSSIQSGTSTPKSDEEELHRIKKVTARLASDQKKQRSHVTAVRKRIASNKTDYFVSNRVSEEAASDFFAHCLYKRCMQGPDEALYCAAFVSMLHELETPGFGTLHLFDRLIVALSRSLFGLTEGEAANASILLHEVWRTVSRWRYDEVAYDSEIAGKPGCFMVAADETQANPVAHKDYCLLYNKWHAAIGATAIGCLQSSQYIHIRNCLIVLTRLVESYPTRPGLAKKLLETLEPLQDESNTFADIRASAQAYSKQLLRARDDGVWKEESAAAVKARKELEESAAAARHEQAKQLMAEISREAEQISEKIGPSETRGRGGERRRMDSGGPRGPGRSNAGSSPTPPTSSATSLPLPLSRETPREDQRSHEQQHRPSDSSAAGASGSYSSIIAGSGVGGYTVATSTKPRDEGSSRNSLEGRWQERDRGGVDRDPRDRGSGENRDRNDRESRDRGSGGIRKRSRPSSPVEDGETAHEDQRAVKRSRPDDSNTDDGSGSRRRKGSVRSRRS